jgi:hypothetical protein
MRLILRPDNIQVDRPFIKLLKTDLGENVNCLTLGKNLEQKILGEKCRSWKGSYISPLLKPGESTHVILKFNTKHGL